jgi:hypothetical protein
VAKILLFEQGDNFRKIRYMKQRTDIGKYSFANRTFNNWKQLPTDVLGAFICNSKIFRNRFRKAIIYRVNESKRNVGEVV